MKLASKKRTPTIVNLTVKRRYLTEREVERLMELRTLGLGHLDAVASGRRQARDHFRLPLNHLGIRPSFPPRQLFLDELD